MRATREACGCRSTDSAWVEMCAAHKAEWQATHERWKAERAARAEEQRVATREAEQDGIEACRQDCGIFDEMMANCT